MSDWRTNKHLEQDRNTLVMLIKRAIKRRHMSYTALSEKMASIEGYAPRPEELRRRINKGNVPMLFVLRIARALDCEILIHPLGKMPPAREINPPGTVANGMENIYDDHS